MGITPTAGITTGTELTLPIGSQGLPLTLAYADAYGDNPSSLTKMPLFDAGLQVPVATGSGTVINPSPLVPAAIYDNDGALRPPTLETPVTMPPRAAGLTQATSPPSLNHETGSLEFGQVVQDISRSLHSPDHTRSSIPFCRLTLSEAGRYSPQYRRRYSSGRAGNHTWNQTKTNDDDVVIGIDQVWGTISARLTYDGTQAVWPEGPRVEAITHYAKADLPSNGLGVSWGDSHNATFLTSLCSAPLSHQASPFIGMSVTDDDLHFSSHWSLNLGVNQPILMSGLSLSSPDAVPRSGASTEDTVSQTLLTPAETIQTIQVSDKFSDGSAPSTIEACHTLGRVDLGNHAVTDSCGLIGFEGVITATAFFSITKDTDPSQAGGVISLTNKNTYAGLNIQVHSGSSFRRNGLADGTSPFRYGSDAKKVDVMTDAMKTSAHRSDDFSVIEANLSQFGTRQHTNISIMGALPNALPRDTPSSVEIAAGTELFSQTQIVADRLFGSTAQSGDSWAGANTLSSGWLADSIPTKVQIIPQVRGYEEVDVTAGGAKRAAYPDAEPIKFRKPIVDYHVLVSVAKRTSLVVKANMSNDEKGDPTVRNDPNPKRLHANMDLSDEPCTIYHGIMRINPTTLEQIYVEPVDVNPAVMDPSEAQMRMSVMPRHSKMTNKASMGWGLHQVTPFKPMASRQWPRVPKLCGAIESGGAYQRGGVSHLWDGAVYGDELFLSADIIDATDFAVETTKNGQPYFGVWGTGQIAPNGNPLPQMPQGTELMVFRYSPNRDPWYSSESTSSTNNPVRTALGSNGNAVNGETTYSAQYKTGLTITDEQLLADSSWEIHDWVIPQMELMRYLGVENKASVMHPKHSQAVGGEIIRHPTAHCSSLRIMDDGKMMMAMIHRDYIETTEDYPSADIGYPPNPDAGIGSCPAGYYLSNGQCVPISGTNPPDGGFAKDPLSGDEVSSAGNPRPTAGSSSDGSPPSDNFGQYPTWSEMIAATSARSLVLAFTDAKAQNGQVARGLGGEAFQVKWTIVPIKDGETQELALQTWSQADTWWSGARISYWYDESGQRAIPITYGSYPESRLSHARLPTSLPWLDSSLKVRTGYPYIQPVVEAAPFPLLTANLVDRLGLDQWARQRVEFLQMTRFTPTTIGFADFGAGANPHQELGWSGWSQPRGLFDPIGYGNNATFFSDSPEAVAVSAGVAVTPTRQAIWKDFGDVKTYAPTAGPYSPFAAVTYDLSSITYPCQMIEWIFEGNNMILAPTTVNNMSDVLTLIGDPVQSLWAAAYEPTFIPFGGATTLNGNFMVRTYEDTPSIQPLEVFNPINKTLNFGTMLFSTGTISPTVHRSSGGNALMRGPFGGWSHQGPLHYGMSATKHPYRVDRVFKQVHGGVGYDLPLHLLIPPNVHVRARAGGRNSIELEMETPFHRTDNLHLIGASQMTGNSGFETAPPPVPNGTRPAAGQYYLRTNLWDAPLPTTGGARTGGYSSNLQRVHGPFVSGTSGLELFWQDHPTDHFHAAAMPILPATDYDLSLIETNRYAPLMLSRASEMHELDVLATSEQLLSSVDVHVSQTARPFWDSGAIVSAQGVGQYDPKGDHIDANHSEQTDTTPFTYPFAQLTSRFGLGKGQRIVRTPDGTLHQFVIKRSMQANSDNQAQWCHMKKPLHSDVFFSRRAMVTNPDTATSAGKDEVGPLMAVLGMGTGTSYSQKARLLGAAFASDSKGTIHAVVELHVNPDDATTHRAHRLYYHKAECRLVTYSPEPVYDWDWSAHTPVLLQSHLASTQEGGGTQYDLRMPSLVCDSKDRLHLTVAQPLESTNSAYSYDQTRILYTSKLPEEASFPNWNPASNAGLPTDGRWQVVNGEQTTTGQNLASAPPHFTNFNCWPKVTLRSDDTPVVFYWGLASSDFSDADRRDGAIYTNIGEGGVAGTFSFSESKCCHVVGLAPDSRNTNTGKPVGFYDAIVDENDKAVVVAIKKDRQTTAGQTWANRQTLMTRFDTRVPLASQYTSTNGLGDTRTLFMGPTYDGVNEMRYVDTYYENPTLTTNGAGEYHLVIGATFTGNDPSQFGKVFRDSAGVESSALAPLIWPATPLTTNLGVPYRAGYAPPAESPDWPEIDTPPYPAYANGSTKSMRHLMHIWFPSYEFDDDATAPDRVIRSINLRWLSVPSMRYDAVKGWVPIGSAQTLAGNEDFPHIASQIRYQRFWGFDAGELDLSWKTNELSWFTTPHAGSKLYYPSEGGVQFTFESNATGEGMQGFPSGV